jgi:hypothetical protein
MVFGPDNILSSFLPNTSRIWQFYCSAPKSSRSGTSGICVSEIFDSVVPRRRGGATIEAWRI